MEKHVILSGSSWFKVQSDNMENLKYNTDTYLSLAKEMYFIINASNTRLKQSQLSNLLEYGYSRNRLFMCFNLYFLIACDELYIKKKNHQILNNNEIIQYKNAIIFFFQYFSVTWLLFCPFHPCL